MSNPSSEAMRLRSEFDRLLQNGELSWESIRLFSQGEELRQRCIAAEERITRDWNEHIYSSTPTSTGLAALVVEMRIMRALREAMGEPPPPVSPLSPEVAVRRATRLIAAGSADAALQILAGAKPELTDTNLQELVKLPDQTPRQLVTPVKAPAPTALPRWLMPVVISNLVFAVLGLLLGLWQLRPINSPAQGASTTPPATAIAQGNPTTTGQPTNKPTLRPTLPPPSEIPTVSTEVATISSQTSTNVSTVTDTVALTRTVTAAPETTPNSIPAPALALEPRTQMLHLLATSPFTVTNLPSEGTTEQTNTWKVLINDKPISATITLQPQTITGTWSFSLTLDDSSYEVIAQQLQATGQPTLTLSFATSDPKRTLPTVQLHVEERQAKGLPNVNAQGTPTPLGEYPNEIISNFEDYLFILTGGQGVEIHSNHAIAVLLNTDFTSPVEKKIGQHTYYPRIAQDDTVQILDQSIHKDLTVYLVRIKESNVPNENFKGSIGWLPAVFIDGL